MDGSLDFKAWYPSMLKSNIVKNVRKYLEETQATIKVDEFELAIFQFVILEESNIKHNAIRTLSVMLSCIFLFFLVNKLSFMIFVLFEVKATFLVDFFLHFSYLFHILTSF